MKKADTLKHRKRLKDRRRNKKIKRQHNYETKTKQRVSIKTIKEEEKEGN